MANRFWVAGSGNWNDTAHWSTTSGGSPGASAPTSTDDAFFDANSFTANGQFVDFFQTTYGQVRNIDFSQITFSIEPRDSLKIYGNCILSPLMDFEADFPFLWFIGSGTMNLTTNGAQFFGSIQVYDDVTGSGSLVLQDDLVCPEDGGSGVEVYTGTFNANGNDYTGGYFYASAFEGFDTNVLMGSGTWNIFDQFTIEEGDPIDSGGVLTLDAGTSTLNFENTFQNSFQLYFDLYQTDLDFYNVTVTLNNNWISIESVQSAFYASPSVVTNVNFNTFTLTRIADEVDQTSSFWTSGNQFSFNTFNANGFSASLNGLIYIFGQDQGNGFGETALFDIGSVSVSNIWVQNNTVTGAASPVTVSVGGRDGGGNTGWLFPVHPVSITENIEVGDGYNGPLSFLEFVAPFNGSVAFGWTGGSGGWKSISERVIFSENFLLEQVTVSSFKTGTPTDDAILSIYSGGTNGENGTLLETKTVAAASYISGGETSFLLDNPINIIGGTTYWFTFTRSGADSASNYYRISATFDDQYADSDFYRKNTAGTWSLASTSFQNELGLKFEFFSHGLEFEFDQPVKDVSVFDLVNIESVTTFDLTVTPNDSVSISEWLQITPPFIGDTPIWYVVASTDINIIELSAVYEVGVDPNRRYWVGDGGSWMDVAHWSYTSGGVGGVDIPQETDDLIFDENSFTMPNQSVLTDATSHIVVVIGFNVRFGDYPRGKTMTWRDVTNNPDLALGSNVGPGTLNENRIIRISGNIEIARVTFTSNMTASFSGTLSFGQQSGDAFANHFNKNGANESYLDMGGLVANFDIDGGYSVDTIGGYLYPLDTYKIFLLSDINSNREVSLSLGSSGGGLFGTIYTNGYNITAEDISLEANTLNLEDSILTGDGVSLFVPDGVNSGPGTGIINGEDASIIISSTAGPSFDGVSLRSFGTVGSLLVEEGAIVESISAVEGVVVTNLTFEKGTSIELNDYDEDDDYPSVLKAVNFTANGTSDDLITLTANSFQNSQGRIYATNVSVSYVDVEDNMALGPGAPFDDRVGGVDSGNNTNWLFEDIGSLSQEDIDNFTAGSEYQLTFEASNLTSIGVTGTIVVKQGSQTILTFTTDEPGSKSVIFTNVAFEVGDNNISFNPNTNVGSVTIDNVSLKKVLQPPVDDNIPIKEFLSGTTDEGREIFFRADTQELQLTPEFEIWSNPTTVLTRLQRGHATKCFVSIDNQDFHELQGNVIKGVSVLKINSRNPEEVVSPTMGKKIQLSWRDSSKQLCRLIQAAIIFTPGTTDYSE